MKYESHWITLSVLLLTLSISACKDLEGGSATSSDTTSTDTTTTVSAPSSVTSAAFTIESVKTFAFSWKDSADATYYKLLENSDGKSGFTQVGDNIEPDEQSVELSVPLYARANAQYIIDACNAGGCTSSTTLSVTGNLTDAIGYFKASNTDDQDLFGTSLAISGDGKTLVVGVPNEDSGATEVDGDQSDDSVSDSGAAYVFTQSAGEWSFEAYIKTNSDISDGFGDAVSLSDDGDILAVSATDEDGSDTGVSGDASDNGASSSGAVYVFTRSAGEWSQNAYLKASNTEASDYFGYSISLSGDGSTLAVGTINEDSAATTINGDSSDNSLDRSGAVYVYNQSGGVWVFDAYIKTTETANNDNFGWSVSLSNNGNTLAASATGAEAVYMFSRSANVWSQSAKVQADLVDKFDYFGYVVSLSDDGKSLAVSTRYEASKATGVDGDATDDSGSSVGAAYVFSLSAGVWSQDAYIKASNAESSDEFGYSMSLSGDGNTLAVGARGEDSSAYGLNGDATNNSILGSGAAYVFSKNAGVWSQEAYVKATNTGASDQFGGSISLDDAGNVLAVGSIAESSSATGIGGNAINNNNIGSGAVYVY